MCAAGYGTASCTECDFGSYKESTGSDDCISCGAGETTASQGSTQASDCKISIYLNSLSSWIISKHYILPLLN